MTTATKTALAQLEQLEQARDAAHAESRAAREPLENWGRDHFGLPGAHEPPPELEAARVEAVDRFHAADTAVRQFLVRNAGAVMAESLPDRDEVCAEGVALLHGFKAWIGRYRGLEHRSLEVLARVGLSGKDLVTDRRVDALAGALDPFDDLDHITAPYSRSAETPAGHLPLFCPNEDQTGWVTWKGA
jgi:hypothetical protein